MTGEVESALNSQVCVCACSCPVIESSLWHVTCLAGRRPIHPCGTGSILQPPIQMPPHSRHSHIFKRAFAHLMMPDSFSALFMPTDSVWAAVQTGWSCCVRVFACGSREEVEQNWGPETSDCVKLLLTGRWGWVGVGGEGAKDWDY